MAVTEAETPEGPWGPLRLIELGGYDWHGNGNLYMFTVNPNPLDPDTLLAVFPLNLGKKGSNKINYAGCHALAHGLRRNETLRRLDLHNNNIVTKIQTHCQAIDLNL